MAKVLISLIILSLVQRIVFALAALLPQKKIFLSADLPTVQVFIVARDEEDNLPDLLQRLEELDYPPEKLFIVLVSDGSVDSTPALISKWCRNRLQCRSVYLAKSSGKSAALQSAWKTSAGAELTAVYDADVLPESGTLRMLVEGFADPRVGAVAGAVVPSNANMNFISRYAALELYVFHQVIQTAKSRLYLNPPAVGANCIYRTAAIAEIGGFPQKAMSEDVAASFDLVDRGWKTSFRPDAPVTTRVPTTLDQFWQQRQRWTRGLTQEIWHAHNLTALQVVLGYADRLVFFASAAAAIFGWVMWFWPVLYFIGPALNILVALHRARVTGKIMLLFSCIPMFVIDVFSTIVGTVSSMCRKKSGWMSIRQRADKD